MKYPSLLLLLLCLCSPTDLLAQRATEVDGDWEGYITMGGIESARNLGVQLHLERKGRWEIVGQTYIKMPDGRIVQMNLQGRIYKDFSMRIWEVEPDEVEVEAPYKRQYQLLFQPDLWDATINGFWQEISPHPTAEGLQRGRIFLKPKEKSGA